MEKQTRKLGTPIIVALVVILATGVTVALHRVVSAHDDNEKAVRDVLEQESRV